jgi:hypothetical protein
MRLDLKIKTLLESLRLTLQLVVADVVATAVVAMVGVEASQNSIVAMIIIAMSSVDMSNMETISVEGIIHAEEIMAAVAMALANSSSSRTTTPNSSMGVTGLPVRFVARLAT